jgi:hypothetical protein
MKLFIGSTCLSFTDTYRLVDHYFILLLCVIWGQLLIWPSFIIVFIFYYSQYLLRNISVFCLCIVTQNTLNISLRLLRVCSYEIWSVTRTKISVYSHTPSWFSCFYELILIVLVLTNSVEESSLRLLCKPMVLPLAPILLQFDPLYLPMAKSTIMKLLVLLLSTFLILAFA